MRAGFHTIIGLAVILSGCAGALKDKGQPLLYIRQGMLLELDAPAFLESHPLEDGENIRVDLLGQDEAHSWHVAQIRDREPWHSHEGSGLRAVLLSGHGTFRLDSKASKVEKGDIISAPAGVPHAFINEDQAPSAAFVIFGPPLKPGDRKIISPDPH